MTLAQERLGTVDAAWLRMEGSASPMIVNAVLGLAEKVPVERVMATLRRGLASAPRMTARIVPPRFGLGLPRWEQDPAFDLARHVEHVVVGEGTDPLLRFVSRATSRLLPLDRPLFRVYVIDQHGAGTTLLVRVHHAVGDGFALLGLLLSMCEGEHAPPEVPRGLSPLRHGPLDYARSLARLVALPPDPHTRLKSTPGLEKRVAWTEPMPLGPIKKAAHLLGASVNDVLIAAAAGAIRPQVAGARDVHAMVPVNLRGRLSPGDLGNRFGLVVLALPVGVVDPIERVAEVKRRTDCAKKSPEAVVAYALLAALGLLPERLEKLGVRFFTSKTSLVLTNVPGPGGRLSFAGAPIAHIMFWVPQSGRLGLGISLLSYAGEVTMGVMADAHVLPDPAETARALSAELARVVREASRRAPS